MTIVSWIISLVLLFVLYGLIWLIIAPIEWIVFFVLLCGLCGVIWFLKAPAGKDTDNTDEEARQRVRERLYKELDKMKKKEENEGF